MRKISIIGLFAIVSTSVYAETLPESKVLQANKRYDSACNSDVLSVTNGNVDMVSLYDVNTYNCPAGEYLVVNAQDKTIECKPCPIGSYCPGVPDTEYTVGLSTTGNNQCPIGYTSDISSAAETDCYKEWACPSTMSCPDNSVNCRYIDDDISGIEYYGDSVKHCQVEFSCLDGYTKTEGREHPLKSAPYNDSGVGSGYVSKDGSNKLAADGLKPGDWFTAFNHGFVSGVSMCSNSPESAGVPDENDSGRYCWCKLTGYAPKYAAKYTDVSASDMVKSSSVWVHNSVYSSTSGCDKECALYCSSYLVGRTDYRKKFFAAADDLPANCQANTIGINWGDVANAGAAATCTYNGDLLTPATEPVKMGHKFRGWVLKESNE